MEEDSGHLDSMISTLMHEVPKINDAAKNLLSEQMAISSVSSVVLDPKELLFAIQSFLKELKSMNLIDPVEYGRITPQKPEQSGLERMEEIIRYKAAFAVWKRVKSSGQSVTKLLGKTFLQITWTQVKSHITTNSQTNQTHVIVVEAFGKSLFRDSSLDVVWTSDISAVVLNRQRERKEQAVQRLKEEEERKEELKGAIIEQLN